MATQTQEKTRSEQQIQGETQETRYERGLKKMSEVYGVPVEEVVAPLRDLGRYMVEFPYGDIYSRDGLAARDREIATIAMLTALARRSGTPASGPHGFGAERWPNCRRTVRDHHPHGYLCGFSHRHQRVERPSRLSLATSRWAREHLKLRRPVH